SAGAAVRPEAIEVKLDMELKKEYIDAAELLGSNGERSIAVAQFVLPPDVFPSDFRFNTRPVNFPVRDLCLIGLVSVVDPPRPDVLSSVRKCQSAAVQ